MPYLPSCHLLSPWWAPTARPYLHVVPVAPMNNFAQDRAGIRPWLKLRCRQILSQPLAFAGVRSPGSLQLCASALVSCALHGFSRTTGAGNVAREGKSCTYTNLHLSASQTAGTNTNAEPQKYLQHTASSNWGCQPSVAGDPWRKEGLGLWVCKKTRFTTRSHNLRGSKHSELTRASRQCEDTCHSWKHLDLAEKRDFSGLRRPSLKSRPPFPCPLYLV